MAERDDVIHECFSPLELKNKCIKMINLTQFKAHIIPVAYKNDQTMDFRFENCI